MREGGEGNKPFRAVISSRSPAGKAIRQQVSTQSDKCSVVGLGVLGRHPVLWPRGRLLGSRNC
jgi:hypothetical protein